MTIVTGALLTGHITYGSLRPTNSQPCPSLVSAETQTTSTLFKDFHQWVLDSCSASYLNAIPFHIWHKVNSVETPGDIILCNPLVSILPSLCRYLNDLRCSFKVHLQPLVMVIVFCWPGPYVSSPTRPMESCQIRTMECIPHGCRRDLVVLDAPCLHSHWSVAEDT